MNHPEWTVRVAAVLVVVACGVTTPALAQDCPELVGRWSYGPAHAVAVLGNYAYFGSGTVLLVADVSDSADMRVVGEVVLPDVMKDVATSSGYGYVADSGGLRIIDVSTPAKPHRGGLRRHTRARQ